MIAIDTLHACDLGVSQDFLANVMIEYMDTMCDGANKATRVLQLWARLKDHYHRYGTENRIQKLTAEMIQSKSKAPKLKAKGAETRALITFALEMTRAMYQHLATTFTNTMYRCAASLINFYMSFEVTPFDPDFTSQSCYDFSILLEALSRRAERRGDDRRWRVKPKAHLMQELGEYQVYTMGNPRNSWNYKDEDFVGWIAKLAKTEGGPRSAVTAALKILNRYRVIRQ